VARRADWRVLDENKGELEPVPSAAALQSPGAEDAVGAFRVVRCLCVCCDLVIPTKAPFPLPKTLVSRAAAAVAAGALRGLPRAKEHHGPRAHLRLMRMRGAAGVLLLIGCRM
jgi:hypothetical protein